MRVSRGMGAMNPSKMPKAKKVKRKDNPNEVTVYAKGGSIPIKDMPPKKPAPPRLDRQLRKYKPRIPPKELT
jgi:hypothetical protein